MVSKVIKRTPTKSLKNLPPPLHHHCRRRKSPVKNATATSVVVASINKSIYTCHRRLIKIFAKLARVPTPKKLKTPRKKGYQILEKVNANPPNPPSIRRSLFSNPIILPPLPSPDKRTVFLDLDETLVHSTPNIPPEKYDFVVRPLIDGERVEFFVLKRPFVDEFLSFLSKKFEIVIFTAGIEEYASLVLDKLDWRKLISHRLYRDSCKEVDGRFVKDLSEIGRELNKVVILDDNPNSYQFQPENAIPIRPFIDNLGDEELKGLMGFFEGCDLDEDMRDAVKLYLAGLNGENMF